MSHEAIELSHLRCFVALAEELHFGRAAARLNMAQPPLTRQIRLLEERIGCRLFERTTRSTRITSAGAALLARTRAILDATGRAIEEAGRIGSGSEGMLRVATAPSLMLGDLPHVIRSFKLQYPKVEVRIDETASSAIENAVISGTADLGLIRGKTRNPAHQTHLRWYEPMVAILPDRHVLAGKTSIEAASLAREPFVFFPKFVGPSFHDEAIGFFARAGFQPQIAAEARQWTSIITLVSAGFGVSAGPASLARLMPGSVRFVPIRQFTTSVELIGPVGAAEPAAGNFIAIARRAGQR